MVKTLGEALVEDALVEALVEVVVMQALVASSLGRLFTSDAAAD